MGTVYLVGAGPGPAELLTLRAYKLLEEADIVIFDRLVGGDILALIPPATPRVDVGKNAGRHPIPQDEINAILLREARRYDKVVRLKGGDPCLFGRGGEEAQFLAAHGVAFQIVPGVTSAIAAPAYAGIPVTHRNLASSLHIITGHGRGDGPVEIDYAALVRLGGTLVFLMSVATAPLIVAGLLAVGMDAEALAAVIENGCTPRQRSFTATLATLPELMTREKVVSPAVIVVGEVCALTETLAWYDKLSLSGCRVLITRPAEAAKGFGAALAALGADVSYYPAIRIEPLDFAINLTGADWLIFTSANGVERFFACLHATGQDSRALAGLSIAAVGEKTALALREHGIAADFIPMVYDGEHLAQELLSTDLVKSGQRVTLYRARQGGEDIVNILHAGGVEVQDIPVYDTIATAEPPPAQDFDIITFTSASCVESFTRSQAAGPYTALCIGPQTAAAARRAGMRVIMADEATAAAMTAKLQEVWHGKKT